MKKYHFFALLSLITLLTSCSVARVDHVPVRSDLPRHLAVFFDGTNNEETSHTNVSKLHSLVSLQGRDDISTTYIRGVGTGLRIIGMAMGWGTGHDVRDAYQYLAENYREGDEVSIYGFSRGAFSARVLAAMLYVSGLPDLDEIEPSKRESFVYDVYAAYKHKTKSLCERRKEVAKVYNEVV